MKNLKPLIILLAEDNVDHAELIIGSLKDFNVANEIVHVNNGEEVLSYLCDTSHTDRKPNLILLDLKMPRMNGTKALEEIRKLPEYKKTPVIMLSTSSIDKDIDDCYVLGANSYLTKPLGFEEFTKKIQDLNIYWVLTAEMP